MHVGGPYLGYGRAVDPDEEGTGITEEEAELLLENDLKRFEEFPKGVLGDTWHVARARPGPPRGADRDVLQYGTG